MSRFSTRIVFLFIVAATFPVALTVLVWLGVTQWGGGMGGEAELARVHVAALDAQRKAAVTRLCRDDLVVDRLLDERAREEAAGLDYGRLFHGSMEAAGLQALWVLDSMTGEVLATGHRHDVLGQDGSTLAGLARKAEDVAFVVQLGDQEQQRFIVRACSISRGGTGVIVVGGHRFSELRSLDPSQLVITGRASEQDEIVATLADAEGVAQSALVWRPRIDRRGPPLLLWIACVAGLALGLALIFGGYLNRWLQASLDDLTVAATRVGRGDLDTTLRDQSTAAFPATATAFNQMTRDLKDAREQLRQTERIAAWQDIARSLAHELKNPLSPIRLSIETLRKAREHSSDQFDALFEESTKTILQEVDRLRAIIDEFSRFARLPAPRLAKINLSEVVSQVVSLHAEGEVEVSAELPRSPIEALVDPDQITQVLHNLVKNACDAATEAHPRGGGAVTVTLKQEIGTVSIRVEDNGPGIPADQTRAIFEPYYTRKRDGTGLGLAITQRIVTEHGGRIDVESQKGRTVITVVLPQG